MTQTHVVRFGVLAFSLNAKGSLIVSFTTAWPSSVPRCSSNTTLGVISQVLLCERSI